MRRSPVWDALDPHRQVDKHDDWLGARSVDEARWFATLPDVSTSMRARAAVTIETVSEGYKIATAAMAMGVAF